MLVSVIVPIYNASNTISAAISSIITSIQKISEDFEIICINDGSTDNSLEIIEKIANENNKIVVISQVNSGVAVARNRGLEVAKGDYIAFNDSDDEWLENHFSCLLEKFKKYPDMCCISGDHDVENKTLLNLKLIEKKFYKVTLKTEVLKNFYSPQATMIRRKIIDDGVRFKNGMRYAEEGYFFYTIVNNYLCGYLNEPITRTITGKESYGDGGLSGNLREMEKGELQNLLYAYKSLELSFFYYCFSVIYSLLKYLRRIIIVNKRNRMKK